MDYKIIMTNKSADGLTSYSLFERNAVVAELSAVTYGIIAADYHNSLTVDDVVTDYKTANTLIDELAVNSVGIAALNEYVMNFLSEL